MIGSSMPGPSRVAPPKGSSRMIWAKAMLLGSSWKTRCFGVGGVIVLLVLLVPRGQHEFSGKWRSLQGVGLVIVEDAGACRFRLAEYSDDGAGKLGSVNGSDYYRVDFKHRGFQQFLLLYGSRIWVRLGIARADIYCVCPFYWPLEFHCVVVNLRRILLVVAAGVSLVALIVSWWRGKNRCRRNCQDAVTSELRRPRPLHLSLPAGKAPRPARFGRSTASELSVRPCFLR